MGKINNNYVVYNPHIDEFIRVKKFSDTELGNIVLEVGALIRKPGIKIHHYVRSVVSRCVEDFKKFDFDEVSESLFECVIEVYPLFQIEVACKAVNELSEDGTADLNVSPLLSLAAINKLENRINKCLVGQSEAVGECITSIKLISSGLGKFVSLFFIGPTGVGKTELARLLAREFLGSSKKLLKINCGEYSTGHEYAKLVGSPPGYVGHNEKGILSERAEQSSQWIILFDEVEKAHPKLINLLLGLLDEGSIVDSHGTELDFMDSIIIFTSNVGIKDNVGKSLVGFGSNTKTYDAVKVDIEKEFKNAFSPEFINRLDSIVYFNSLSKKDAALIARLNLLKLPVTVTKKLVKYVVDGGFSEEFGARNIKRFIRNNITIKIAEKVLEKSRAKKYAPVFENKKLTSVREVN